LFTGGGHLQLSSYYRPEIFTKIIVLDYFEEFRFPMKIHPRFNQKLKIFCLRSLLTRALTRIYIYIYEKIHARICHTERPIVPKIERRLPDPLRTYKFVRTKQVSSIRAYKFEMVTDVVRNRTRYYYCVVLYIYIIYFVVYVFLFVVSVLNITINTYTRLFS